MWFRFGSVSNCGESDFTDERSTKRKPRVSKPGRGVEAGLRASVRSSTLVC